MNDLQKWKIESPVPYQLGLEQIAEQALIVAANLKAFHPNLLFLSYFCYHWNLKQVDSHLTDIFIFQISIYNIWLNTPFTKNVSPTSPKHSSNSLTNIFHPWTNSTNIHKKQLLCRLQPQNKRGENNQIIQKDLFQHTRRAHQRLQLQNWDQLFLQLSTNVTSTPRTSLEEPT